LHNQPTRSQQEANKKPTRSQREANKKPMSASHKNFVVGFRNDSDNVNAIMNGGYGKNIMDIMVAINSSGDYEDAKKQKIPCIQNYIYKNMQYIDFLIYLYGHSLVMEDYINRFGPIQYSPILEVDFATIIIDNIIVIYEAREFPVNTPTSLVDSSIQYDSQDIETDDASVVDEKHNNYDSYFDDEEELSTSQLISKYDNILMDDDILKILSDN
jgi:hypothetical protein